jgi:hypothetical protein
MRLAAIDHLLILMHRVHEHHSDDVTWIGCNESSDDEAPIRLANENVGRFNSEPGERSVELKGELGEGPRASSWVAPRIAASVETADAGEPRYFGLNERPNDRDIPSTSLEEDGRRSRAAAVDMKVLPPDVDQHAGWRRDGFGRRAGNSDSNWQQAHECEAVKSHGG